MSIPDMINALFESSAGLFLWNNVRLLFKQKRVRGVSVLSTAVFTLWGFWNLYYYPHLNQWWSFFGGLWVVTANTTWVYLALHYRKKEKRIKEMGEG